jgi:hypothetical protein
MASQTIYHCEVGWCEGDDFYGTADLSQARGSGVITGSNETETISGTLTGHTLEWASGAAGTAENQSAVSEGAVSAG